MSSFTKSCKICGLILMLIMVLRMFTSGSSASCRCSLSCDGASELTGHEKVEVHVEHHSDKVYNKVLEVSSLFKGGHCSVVVPNCLQGYKWVVFRIYTTDKKKPHYEKYMDLKPECDTEKPPEERSGADRISSNTLLILLIIGFSVVFKFLPKNWCHFRHRTHHSTLV